MIILRQDLDNFLVSHDTDLMSVLKKIEINKTRLVFVVDQFGYLIGAITDGDIRRQILNNQNISKIKAKNICNRNIKKANISYSVDHISNLIDFTKGITSIPIVNHEDKLIKIANFWDGSIHIGSKRIDRLSKPYVIAEIGNNHNGSLSVAKDLILSAKKTGVDCVKFQHRNLKKLYGSSIDTSIEAHDLGSQYTVGLLKKYQLNPDQLFDLFDYCIDIGIEPLCTPWDLEALIELEKYDKLSAYKIASADFTNYELIKAVAQTGKSIILSTGMTTEEDILNGIKFLNSLGIEFALLHCNSTYPASKASLNLKYINNLLKKSNCVIGYSSHDIGIEASLYSIALGARIIEKHITKDKSLEGTDHKVSLVPSELEEFILKANELYEILGNDSPRVLSQGELLNKETLGKSLWPSKKIVKGTILNFNDIYIRSPGTGVQPNKINDFIGKKLLRDVSESNPFIYEDVDHIDSKAKLNFNFSNDIGIPIRFHDYSSLLRDEYNFLEFHLSFNDLLLEPEEFIKYRFKGYFIVHAPELFENDHILDLASADDLYRKKSIQNLKKVVEFSLRLRKFCINARPTRIVVNVGGATSTLQNDYPKDTSYLMIADALIQLNDPNIQFIIQTMPPFPWHFGGQRYHNLFIDVNECINFSNKYKYKICLDVSHSALAWGCEDIFYKNIEKIMPYVDHIHLADAIPPAEEGLQIGHGLIDFEKLMQIIENFKNISFLPEIWQGHKNNGLGFNIAFKKLFNLINK